ncbi:MAG: 2-amino-4-hydroxy-6-hydroxymethyldihydropteridine diphosphokinase [Thermoanaerobaculaceae bacterium]|jgi:2-amino-4-hydroxy-6-hydroxymethyldihydropteridine diphosphokinase|nr:2-amino-4-hydroxy-6-hydroxymethyldihydropteridine diphosphokinase [Thermoanaerobaculaceae bacterium]
MRLLLGLGGNLGDVAASFATTAAALAREHRLLAASGLWRSAPVGPTQPAYLNAALLVEVGIPLSDLLAACHELEAAAGRDRACELRWGPRTLDIDLLVAPGLVVESPALSLPHPRLAERRFALLPACELAPDWIHPRLHRPLRELLAALDALAQPCRPAGPFPLPGVRLKAQGSRSSHPPSTQTSLEKGGAGELEP